MDKSLNEIYAQAQRICNNYPEQLERRYWGSQQVFQIAARVRAARGISMFTTERDVKHGLRREH